MPAGSSHIREEDIAWAAGFFDAEGCYSYSPAGRFAALSIGQTDRRPLDRFRRIIQAGTIRGPVDMRSARRPSKQPQYQLYLYRRKELKRVAGLLFPHLGTVKRRQLVRVSWMADFDAPTSPPTTTRSWRVALAWAAGFFDGDGCFSLTRASRYPCVSITQQHPEVLLRFAEAVGLGKLYGPYRHRTKTLSTKPFCVLRVHGFAEVQAVAAMLWPWLGDMKRRQAWEVLRWWPRTCRRGHPRVQGHNGCGACTADYWRAFRSAKLLDPSTRANQSTQPSTARTPGRPVRAKSIGEE